MSNLDLYAKIEPLIGFYDDYERLYRIYIDLLHQFRSNTILDVGCGSGRFLQHLRECSYLGIDISEEMVKICKNLGLNSQYTTIDKVQNKFDAIVCIADVLNYMTKDELKEFLSIVPQKLNHDGYFICDINTMFGFKDVASGAMAKDSKNSFLSIEADFSNSELISKFIFFEKEGDLYKKSKWSIKQYAYEVSDINENLDLELQNIVDIHLFSDEYPDKNIIIFKNS
jgi:SAM-dependent methyltransferase